MNRILSSRFDWGILGASFALIFMGLLALASGNSDLFSKQIIWLVFALALMFGLPMLNIRALFSYRWAIWGLYFFVLMLLVVTAFVAPTVHGTKSWIVIGPVQIQPSEFMKAVLIILLSSFFAVRHAAIARIGIIISSFLYFLVPVVLVLLQPDLGTSLVLFGIWFGYLLISGLPPKYVTVALMVIVVLGAVAWGVGLADYQKARIVALFTPSMDQLGVNYSVAQSKVAIGSAGLFGKGFGQGTQVQLGFLPAAQTDFIFSAFVEEWGLIGGTVLIGTFLFLLYRILRLGIRSTNNFARFAALGTAVLLFLHFVVNLGSALGLLPVVGVGLPLVSYGGSNLLTVAALIGIIQGITYTRIVH